MQTKVPRAITASFLGLMMTTAFAGGVCLTLPGRAAPRDRSDVAVNPEVRFLVRLLSATLTRIRRH